MFLNIKLVPEQSSTKISLSLFLPSSQAPVLRFIDKDNRHKRIFNIWSLEDMFCDYMTLRQSLEDTKLEKNTCITGRDGSLPFPSLFSHLTSVPGCGRFQTFPTTSSKTYVVDPQHRAMLWPWSWSSTLCGNVLPLPPGAKHENFFWIFFCRNGVLFSPTLNRTFLCNHLSTTYVCFVYDFPDQVLQSLLFKYMN